MKKKIIIVTVLLFCIIIFAHSFQNITIAKTAKSIMNSSYELYGKDVPKKYEDIVSDYYFALMNHREQSDKIISEENQVYISSVHSGLYRAEVRLFYEYHTFDSNGNDYIGTTGTVPVTIRFIKKNGKWVVSEYIEDP